MPGFMLLAALFFSGCWRRRFPWLDKQRQVFPYGDKMIESQQTLQKLALMEKQMMYALQNLLTAAIEIIPGVFFTLMAVDLIAGLVKLWDCTRSQTEQILQLETPDELPALATQTAMPEPEDKPQFLPSEIQPKTGFMPETIAEIDSQAIALSIQKSKQATIRTVAQRLGIAIKVNSRYQRLDYLRAQLLSLLESQPHEVARIFAQLGAEAAV